MSDLLLVLFIRLEIQNRIFHSFRPFL